MNSDIVKKSGYNNTFGVDNKDTNSFRIVKKSNTTIKEGISNVFNSVKKHKRHSITLNTIEKDNEKKGSLTRLAFAKVTDQASIFENDDTKNKITNRRFIRNLSIKKFIHNSLNSLNNDKHFSKSIFYMNNAENEDQDRHSSYYINNKVLQLDPTLNDAESDNIQNVLPEKASIEHFENEERTLDDRRISLEDLKTNYDVLEPMELTNKSAYKQASLEINASNDNNLFNDQSKDNESRFYLSSMPQPLFYVLKINLKDGKSLAIRDISGSSDPYAKFILNTECVYKSKIIHKNLNPTWNEEFMIRLPRKSRNRENVNDSRILVPNAPVFSENSFENTKLTMFVYDYDRGFLNDDLIGHTAIPINDLIENVDTCLELELKDEKHNSNEYLGLISLNLKLIPKFNDDEDSISRHYDMTIRNKRNNQLWHCVVNIVLIEGMDLLSMDDNGYSDPYVKFRLGMEKYRSRTIKRTLNPVFMEQFQLYVYDISKMTMTISVHDYDTVRSTDEFMGKAYLDLKSMEIEKTHEIRLPLEDGAGFIRMLVTVTGTSGFSSIADLDYNKEIEMSVGDFRGSILSEYSLSRSFKDMANVGWLQVKVLRAEGLASMDINGKSDPLCTLQIINQYAQTHTEYKTLNPEWGKIFEFRINDIHAILEVTVFDEDKNKVYEFLGKIQIPIINIQNNKRKIYALKDRKLLRRTKGTIELELNLVYNPIKAVLRTFRPRETKFIEAEQKLKIPVLKQNIMRIHDLAQGFINTGKFIKSCLDWESPVRSAVLFFAFILIVLNFETYMLPLTILLIFAKNYILLKIKSNLNYSYEDEDSINFDYYDDDEENSDTNKNTIKFTKEVKDFIDEQEPKKSFREKLNEIQDICLKVQEALDFVASLGERVVNTFNFTVPWLSYLAISILTVGCIVLYFIPIRFLILAYGVHKFTLKFRKPPDYIDNKELLDFLSRVPSKKELFSYKEFKTNDQNASSSLQNTNTDRNLSKNKTRNFKPRV